MGAESSFLKSCELGEPLEVTAPDWSIHPAKRPDGSKVTVFVNKKKEEDSDDHIENATRQLKILRHPTILKFFDCCKSLDGTFLVTEQVQPLELALERLSPEEICSGLFNIVEALAFLHDKGGVSHNNVCITSIYVSSQDGGWRLGGMEHVCKFEDATVTFLKQCREQRLKRAIPPEEQDENTKTSLAPDIGHARDAYAFGVLVQEMLEYIGNLGEMTDVFNRKIERDFLNDDPRLRPKLSTLLNDPFFKNDFLEITRFLHNITVKTESEKNTFFEGVAPRIYGLPQQIVATKILPLLLTSFALAEPVAVSMLLPHILSPVRDYSKRDAEFDPQAVNPVLSEDLFRNNALPILLKMFPSREIHVRHVLLQFLPGYVHLFEESVLKNRILPLLLVGLKDANDDMVSCNLRGLADLVPILGAQVVVGGERVRYFVEGRPKFPMEKREEKSLSSRYTKQLTAVSGVITIPRMTPTSPPQPLPTYSEEKTHPEPTTLLPPPSNSLGETERVDSSRGEWDAKQKEREERRREMRLKNERRKKEREEKRRQENRMGALKLDRSSSGSDTPLSPVDDSIDRRSPVDDSINRRVSLRANSLTDAVASPTPEEGVDSGWLDWDNVGEGENFKPIEADSSHQSQMKPLRMADRWDSWEQTDTSDWSVPESRTHDHLLQSGSAELNHGRENEPTPRSASQRTEKSMTPVTPQKKDGFGGIFEIPEIKMNTSANLEFDFFADMEPDLSFRGSAAGGREKSSSRRGTIGVPGDMGSLGAGVRGVSSSEGESFTESSLLLPKDEEPGPGWEDEDLDLTVDV